MKEPYTIIYEVIVDDIYKEYIDILKKYDKEFKDIPLDEIIVTFRSDVIYLTSILGTAEEVEDILIPSSSRRRKELILAREFIMNCLSNDNDFLEHFSTLDGYSVLYFRITKFNQLFINMTREFTDEELYEYFAQ